MVELYIIRNLLGLNLSIYQQTVAVVSTLSSWARSRSGYLTVNLNGGGFLMVPDVFLEVLFLKSTRTQQTRLHHTLATKHHCKSYLCNGNLQLTDPGHKSGKHQLMSLPLPLIIP